MSARSKVPPLEVDRPFTLALSRDEVVALVKFHTACARSVPRRLGKALMESRSTALIPNFRSMRIIQEEARRILDSHSSRAKGLLSIIGVKSK